MVGSCTAGSGRRVAVARSGLDASDGETAPSGPVLAHGPFGRVRLDARATDTGAALDGRHVDGAPVVSEPRECRRVLRHLASADVPDDHPPRNPRAPAARWLTHQLLEDARRRHDYS